MQYPIGIGRFALQVGNGLLAVQNHPNRIQDAQLSQKQLEQLCIVFEIFDHQYNICVARTHKLQNCTVLPGYFGEDNNLWRSGESCEVSSETWKGRTIGFWPTVQVRKPVASVAVER